MSLSPLVSFKSRFVTYLLNFPRTLCHWPYKTPKSVLVSSCRLLHVTLHTRNKRTPNTAGVDILPTSSYVPPWRQKL